MIKENLPKNRLYEFDCEVFPRKLWVIYDNERLARNRFVDADSEKPIDRELFKTSYAITADVQDKRTGDLGILIHFNKGEKERGGSRMVGDIAHESVHALDYILIDIHADHDRFNDETSAYIVGWVASKCWKVLQNYI